MKAQLDVQDVALAIAERFSALDTVTAVVLAGSRTVATTDASSDYDLYVYATEEIDPEARRELALAFADCLEIDNRFWEPGDEWRDSATGLHVDIMYRSPEWIEAQLTRVLEQNEASVGYSTCFWYNVRVSRILFDREGWFRNLQARADVPYPEALRRAIVAKNWPILRNTFSSYVYQLTSAVDRNDRVSINHRIAALLASYFDILCAVNRLPHPGEKRLVQFAQRNCLRLPEGMLVQLDAVLTAAGGNSDAVLPSAHALLDGLEALLREEGLV
ncbi:MAG: hypothetical protein BWY63_00132 [Chloroflexi bacterium ADurb.Bin360]|nr:MAG: hypothetical protein BWY63_00132 [Chloroflexi bacterium ADurb.Bin360]